MNFAKLRMFFAFNRTSGSHSKMSGNPLISTSDMLTHMKKMLRTPKRSPALGFTLVELLVTVAVLGVIIAIALPNLQSFLVNNRINTMSNHVLGVMNFARAEAIARNKNVVVCSRRTTADSCTTNQNWAEREILVCIDDDNDGTCEAAENKLKRFAPQDTTGQYRINRPGSGNSTITFGPAGYARAAIRLEIYPEGSSDFIIQYGRTVCVSLPGRARVIPYIENCS
jgi:type IV fimbrial biogenesis protein FimT